MRTLACLAAVILAGVPAAAAPLLIDDFTTTGLLPVEQLLTEASWTAVDNDGNGDTAMLAPAGRFVLAVLETPIGLFDEGVADAIGPGGWDAYRSTVTSELLRIDDDEFAVSRYSIDPADARDGAASGRESLDASPPAARRDVERAAMSNVQPAALTLLGVCLFLIAAGGREWNRRNWHRRHMRRRG